MEQKKELEFYIKLSKSLSWVLRHKATKLGLEIDSAGYILVEDILKLKQFSGYVIEDVEYVVITNDKQRFSMYEDEYGDYYIRANQGHSNQVAKHINQDELLTKLDKPLDIVVHGTTYEAYPKIKTSGLKKMGRSHIHFAISDDFIKGNQQQSGIRRNCDLLIYLDMEAAMADGIDFYMSDNKVVLSEGVGEEGLISHKYFKKVIDRDSGEEYK